MAKTTLSRSFTVKGDIGATFFTIKRKLEELNFTETSTVWPSALEFRRGKGGMFAKDLKDVKTDLKASLKQASDHVNILFEYTFHVPSSYIDKDRNFIEQEFMRLKHELTGTSPQDTAKKGTICDVCLSPIGEGESFCRNCGRSAKRQKTEIQDSKELDVEFDPNRVAFGQKTVDDVLYGGIPQNGVVLITSPACEEKEIILTRFIETGLDQGETVVYVSTDTKMTENEKIVQNNKFYQVICNSQVELTSKCITENCLQVKGVERLTELSVALTTMLNNVAKTTENNEKTQRLVLDILSDTLLSNQSVNTRKWLRETITKFKQKNFTILATLNPHMHSKEDTQSLLDLFDGQIEIYEKELQNETRMFLRVKRLNNNRYSSKETMLVRENLLIHNSK